jgi:hypothetical protein
MVKGKIRGVDFKSEINIELLGNSIDSSNENKMVIVETNYHLSTFR